MPYLFEQIESFIFGKSLHEFKVWEELQSVLQKKGKYIDNLEEEVAK
jgi:hypothetical protein